MTDQQIPIGYGNPPKHSQFKKGKSGNPKGRPRQRFSLVSDLFSELQETLVVKEDGRLRRITKQRALVKGLVAAAFKGNHQAFRVIAMFTTEDLRMSDAERWAEKERKEAQTQAAISKVMKILHDHESDSK